MADALALAACLHEEPTQFAFNIITRSRRVTHDNLRLRDPEFVGAVDRWFARGAEVRPPMFQSYRLGGLELHNRVVVSAMDMYSARDGVPTDFHLVHLGGKALGGAALVMTEMVCVSSEGRITPGCGGLYTAEQEAAWAPVRVGAGVGQRRDERGEQVPVRGVQLEDVESDAGGGAGGRDELPADLPQVGAGELAGHLVRR